MGSWSTKPFGNDSALDWLAGLEGTSDVSHLKTTIENLPADTATLEAPESEEVVAAAAVIAAAAFEPICEVPEAAKRWIAEQGYVPSLELTRAAQAALDRIVAHSELRELWEESGSLMAWLKNTNRVIDRLKAVGDLSRLRREPKSRGVPRTLYKLVELDGIADNMPLRQRIRAKLLALPDASRGTIETAYAPPLLMLASTPLVEEALMLIERGADLNLGRGEPLVTACGAGQVSMAEALLQAGAKLFEETLIDAKSGIPMDSVWNKRRAQPKVFRYAPGLIAAAMSGTPETIDLLLSHGADLNQTFLNGETLLHYAAQGGNTATIRHLIGLGLDVNQTKTHSFESPLHFAVSEQRLDAARVLLEHGATPNIVDKYRDQTALDDAGRDSSPLFRLIRSFGGLRASEIVENNCE